MNDKKNTLWAVVGGFFALVIAFILGKRSGKRDDNGGVVDGIADELTSADAIGDIVAGGLDSSAGEIDGIEHKLVEHTGGVETVAYGIEEGVERLDDLRDVAETTVDLAQRNQDIIAELRKRNSHGKD